MDTHKNKERHYGIVALIMLTFFVISFLTNAIGPIIPDIINSFHLNLTLVAVLPFAFFIAYGIMSLPSAVWNEKFKEKKMMLFAFIISFGGATWLAIEPNYLTAVFSLFLIGCGMAVLQVVINPLLRVAGGEEHYAFNSVLAQLFFGLASFLTPLLYAYLVKQIKHTEPAGNSLVRTVSSVTPRAYPWISLYWVFALICLLMLIVILISRFPLVNLKADEKAGSLAVYKELLKNKVVVMYFAGIFCYVGTEQGVANWISQFLHYYHHYDSDTIGAKAVADFWGLMTLGGVVGLILLKFIDSKKVLVSFTILAIIFFTLALFGPRVVSLWCFPIVGFFASVMYPVLFSLALNSVKGNHGPFSGILLTGVTGGALIPLIIGKLGDIFDLRAGMMFIYITLFFILFTGIYAKPIIKNKVIRINKKD